MPIEVRELIIRVNIEDKPATTNHLAKEIQDIKTQVVKECLEKLMSKLENSQGR